MIDRQHANHDDFNRGSSGLQGATDARTSPRRRALGQGRQVPARGSLSRLAWGWVLLIFLLPLGACDFIAQKKLVAGESTEADVRRWMGQPELIWEDDDGSRVLEYPRGPMGLETFFVSIGPDGRYRSTEQVLTDANFERVKAGMTRDDVRQILGKPTETVRFALSKEEVWSWRHKAPDTRIMFFNVHFDQDTGLAKKVSKVQDWKRERTH